MITRPATILFFLSFVLTSCFGPFCSKKNPEGDDVVVDSVAYISMNQYLDSLENEDPFGDYSHVLRPRSVSAIPQTLDDAPSREELRRNAHLSDSVWVSRSWSSSYSKNIYRSFVSPYRIDTETAQCNWRKEAIDDWGKYALGDTPVEMASHIMSEVSFGIYSMFRGRPGQPYELYNRYKRGTCKDFCIYSAQILRANGIPVAVDIIPCWGSHDLGHSFNSIIGPKGETLCSFNDGLDFKGCFKLEHKVPKVYRKTFRKLNGKAKNDSTVPELFRNSTFEDVTGQFNLPSHSIRIPSLMDDKPRMAYLAVFRASSWTIVAEGERNHDSYSFKDVGAGYLHYRPSEDAGEDIGNGILYLPVYYRDDRLIPFNDPFILSVDGDITFVRPEGNTGQIVIHRKYPRFRRVVSFAEELAGGVFECSSCKDFSDATVLFSVSETPPSHPQVIRLAKPVVCRYMRFRKPRGGFSLAELHAYDMEGELLSATPFSLRVLQDEIELSRLVDGCELSFFSCQGEFHDLWVGLDLETDHEIRSFSFCPRTDGNDITVGDEYELFAWSEHEWRSFGCKKAITESLEFDSIPLGCVFLLKDRTSGKEERPFTIINGRQVWW